MVRKLGNNRRAAEGGDIALPLLREERKHLFRFPHFLVLGLLVLVVLLALLSAHFYNKLHTAQTEAVRQGKEAQELVEEVGALMVLPDEMPTIATVTDPEKLKSQAFFAQAKMGDKVLIYTGARKAILYDPQTKKIINVAPITIDTEQNR